MTAGAAEQPIRREGDRRRAGWVTHQDALHGVGGARVFVVGGPVQRNLALAVGDADVGVVFDEQFDVFRVVIKGTPVQGSLLQG